MAKVITKVGAAKAATKATPRKAGKSVSSSATKKKPNYVAKATGKLPAEPAPFFLGGYEAKSCPTLVMKNHHDKYSEQDKDPFPSGVQARIDSGIVFEPEVGALWAAALGKRFLAIPKCDRTPKSKKLRENLTLAAMKKPGKIQVIWNGRFPQNKDSHQTGEPDALLRYGVDKKGVHLWVPIDIKKHKSLQGTRKNAGTRASTFASPQFGKATLVDIGVGIGKEEDALQIAHYYRMLQHLGHAAPIEIGGIIGTELLIVWHQLGLDQYNHPHLGTTNALAIYDYDFAAAIKIAASALLGVAVVEPEWKPECPSCVWRTSCHDELTVDLDHITLLPGVSPLRAKVHYGLGVRRITQLTRLDWRTAMLVDVKANVPELLAWAASVPPETPVVSWPGANSALQAGTFPKIKVATAADALTLDTKTASYADTGVWHLADTIDQSRVAKVRKAFLAREVTSVGINRSVYEQDIDIEDCEGYVYLIGVRTSGYKRASGRTMTELNRAESRSEYDAFVNWDRTVAGEARVFVEFWAHIQKSMLYADRSKYGYRAYYYTHHEPSQFKSLAERHAGVPGVPTVEEVAAYFALKEVIDLYAVLSKQLIWPTESLSLKEIAKWVRFSWRDSDPAGGNSLAWYQEATTHPDTEVRLASQHRLLEYNEDDVSAQVAIRDWLSRLGEARHPGKKLPSIATLDRRFYRQ